MGEAIQLRLWVPHSGRLGDLAPATAAGGAGPIGWVGVEAVATGSGEGEG
jgi:hypothetical protein